MKRTAFVTGATGFLGAFFTVQLLRQGLPVLALVRNVAERSLLPTFEEIGTLYPDFSTDRVADFTGVDGDIRAQNCGLSDFDFERVTSQATDIWHFAAAFDDQGKGDGEVYATNVGGTDNLLNLLTRCKNAVRLNYVSTAYAGPVVDNISYERLARPEEATGNEYETTKAEAERRLTSFCQANGIEYRIFRPPIVAGESNAGFSLGYTGYQGVFRALYLLKRRLEINIGSWFDHDLHLRVIADPELMVNVVPADFVTEAMWRISEDDQSAGSLSNVTSARTVALETLFETASDTLGVRGIHLSLTHDFDAVPMSLAERLFRRRMKFQEPYFLQCSQFDSDNFRRFVPEVQLPSPACSTAYLALCNQYCLSAMEQEFLDAGEKPTIDQTGDSGPDNGQVDLEHRFC